MGLGDFQFKLRKREVGVVGRSSIKSALNNFYSSWRIGPKDQVPGAWTSPWRVEPGSLPWFAHIQFFTGF